jgi:deoxyinosine 3'endonuclease (endonuclease V)
MTAKQIAVATEIAKELEFIDAIHMALMIVAAVDVSFDEALAFVVTLS